MCTHLLIILETIRDEYDLKQRIPWSKEDAANMMERDEDEDGGEGEDEEGHDDVFSIPKEVLDKDMSAIIQFISRGPSKSSKQY